MSTKRQLQIELLRLEEEIELLTLDQKDKIKQVGKEIRKKKKEIEELDLIPTSKKKKQIEKLSLEKTRKLPKKQLELLSLEKTRKLPKKQLELLTLEKTKELNLQKLQNTKKFTKNEIKYLNLEMSHKVEQKKLEQELKIDVPKLDQKIQTLVDNNKIEKSPVLPVHNLTKVAETNSKKKFFAKGFYIFLLVSSIIVLFFILKALLDRRTNDTEIKTQIGHIINNTEITLDDTEGQNETEESDYYKYMRVPFISVNFDELKAKNSSTKGWIQVAGTNINYPYVQAKDNDYYLSHSFDKSYNTMGWVFLDYRNNSDTWDKNSILYAHGLYNNTMFGSLKQVIEPSWYTNSENHLIKISKENENSVWEVFSTYTIKPESFYITTNFEDDKSFEAFVVTLQGRSVYDYNVSVSENDRILTLSSCYNDDLRVVVHAKLIKTSARS